LAASGLALLSGLVVAVWWHWAGWLVALGGAVCGGWALRVRTSQEAGTSGQSPEDIEEQFRREIDSDAPEAWGRDAVEARIQALDAAAADGVVEQQLEQTWSSHKSSLETDDQKLDALRREAREALGVVPRIDDEADVSLVRTVEHLRRYQRHCDELAGIDESIQKRNDQLDAELEPLRDMIEGWGFERPSSVERAHAWVERARELETRRQTIVAKLNQSADALAEAEEAAEDATSRLKSLYEQIDLEVGDRDALESLCRTHDEWETCQGRAEELRRERDILVRQYRSRHGDVTFEHDDLSEPPWEAATSTLMEAKEAAASRADRASELQDEISKTRHDIDRARASNDLEEATARLRSRRDALARERREDYEKHVGDALAGFIHRKTRDRELPDVFHRARSLFAQVTRGAYRLELADEREPMFRAYDTVADRRQPLDTLSSGTRLQLLLTVRMAFTERDERGVAMPLVFDETLANSDDTRARALVDAIADIAARGRQVFYLTAQSDEIRQWRAVCESSDDLDYQLHRLQGVTDGSTEPEQSEVQIVSTHGAADWVEDVEAPQVASSTDLPAPSEGSHASYGRRLDPPAWHPREPIGAVHLWYIVEDVDLLYRLLSAGVRTWGHLRTLDEVGANDIVSMSAETYAGIHARARAIRAFAQAWKQGRGKPVDRQALEASGAVSDNFIDEVAAVCAEYDGEADVLIERLEAGDVKRFRSSKIDELRTYFLEEGFLVTEDPLDEEAVFMQVLASVSGEVRDDVLDREAVERVIGRVANK
jgi:hypothetical protein